MVEGPLEEAVDFLEEIDKEEVHITAVTGVQTPQNVTIVEKEDT